MDIFARCIVVAAVLMSSPSFAGSSGKRGIQLNAFKEQCAQQTGASYDYSLKHYTGTPEQMGAWKKCVGR